MENIISKAAFNNSMSIMTNKATIGVSATAILTYSLYKYMY